MAHYIYHPSSKIVCKFVAVGNAPQLVNKRFATIQGLGSKTFGSLVTHIKKALRSEKSLGPNEPIYLYLQQSFIPDEDMLLQDLNEHFGSGNELIISYSKIPQWL
eukprot:UN00389